MFNQFLKLNRKSLMRKRRTLMELQEVLTVKPKESKTQTESHQASWPSMRRQESLEQEPFKSPRMHHSWLLPYQENVIPTSLLKENSMKEKSHSSLEDIYQMEPMKIGNSLNSLIEICTQVMPYHCSCLEYIN